MNLLKVFFLLLRLNLSKKSNFRKKIELIKKILKISKNDLLKTKVLSYYVKLIKENFENADIIYHLEFILDEFQLDLTNKNSSLLIQEISFKKDLYFEKELFLILDILIKNNLKLDHLSSRMFFNYFLHYRIKSINDYHSLFSKLSLINFDFFLFKEVNFDFLNHRIFENYSVDELKVLAYYEEERNRLNILDIKLFLLNEIYLAKKKLTTINWLKYFLNLYKIEESNLGSFEFISLLKINSKFKFPPLKNKLLSITNELNLLHFLIKNDYDFKNVSLFCEKEIFLLNNCETTSELVGSIFLKKGKHLVKIFSKQLIMDDNIINFNFLRFCNIFEYENLDFIQAIIPNLSKKDCCSELDNEHMFFLRNVFSQINSTKKKKFLIDAFENQHYFNSIKKVYQNIMEKDHLFKIDFKYESLFFLNKKLEIIYQTKYFNNYDLKLIDHFPFLKQIDGFQIDDLRFEIPKTSYDLFVYGLKMHNCIYTYANNCLIKSSIIIGVYKDNNLEYNLEVGDNQFSNLNNLEFYLISNRKNKLKIVQFEKKFKKEVSLYDRFKITNVLINHKII